MKSTLHFFTPGEWVLLIGLLAHAIAIYFALRASKMKLDKVAVEIHSSVEKIEEVRTETNSMRRTLETAARAEGKAEGIIEGREEERESRRLDLTG